MIDILPSLWRSWKGAKLLATLLQRVVRHIGKALANASKNHRALECCAGELSDRTTRLRTMRSRRGGIADLSRKLK
jgi:hypothetical protein